MAEVSTRRVAQGGRAGPTAINRRRIIVFFQRFPGTDASSGIQGLDFTVTIPGSPPVNGQTPADGRVEIRLLPGETARLAILGSEYDVSLLTGGLHPITDLRGVQQRLNMLGYTAGPLAGAAVLANTGLNGTESTEHAIINFQADHDPLQIDGVAGGRTQPVVQRVVRQAGGE